MKINIIQLRKELKPAYHDRGVKKLALSEALNFFDEKHAELIDEFDNHDVTKEIEEGPYASNISRTLRGTPDGNLFSFIGFWEGTDPIAPIRNILNGMRVEKKDPRIVHRKDFVSYDFDVKTPEMKEIYDATPFPDWDGGVSWVRGIETHISGAMAYWFKRNGGFLNSRSGPAIQVKNPKRSGSFKRTDYISKMMSRFRGRFNKKVGI